MSLRLPQDRAATPSPADRVPYTDALRAFGALAVIVIHVAGDGSSSFSTLSQHSWAFCVILEALSRFAVPVFIMVSGLLLLDPRRDETPGQFYLKRLRRIAVPMLIWSAFYLAWRWFYEDERFSAWTAVKDYVSGDAYFHLWFVMALLGLYLCTPALRVIVRNMTLRQVWWCAGTVILLGIGDAVLRATGDTDFTFLFKFTPYIGYFLLGYCLRKTVLSPNMVWVGAGAWVFGAALAAVGADVVVFHLPTVDWNTDNRLFLLEEEYSPATVISSIGFFTMIRAWYETRPVKENKAVQAVAAASLGIYLVHPAVLAVMNNNDVDYTWHSVYVGVPLQVAVGMIASTAISLLFLRIPGLKLIV